MARGRVLTAALSILFLYYGASAADGKSTALDGAESRFATLDGGRVHYKSIGTGRDAVVFVHGWTCNMNFWREQVESLKGKVRVIAIDLPGHGLSDKPQVAYTMDYFARGIDAALRDAGVERAVLVGHSMGTPVVRQFYRRHPEKTLALVVVDGGLRSMFTREMGEQFIAMLRGPNYKEQAARMVERDAHARKGPGAARPDQGVDACHPPARYGGRDGRHDRPGDLQARQDRRAGPGDTC